MGGQRGRVKALQKKPSGHGSVVSQGIGKPVLLRVGRQTSRTGVSVQDSARLNRPDGYRTDHIQNTVPINMMKAPLITSP